MKIQFLRCLLLLCVFGASQGSFLKRRDPESVTDMRYKKFIKQHVIAEMGAKDCDKVINQRSISKTDSSECKDVNTFVLASPRKVKGVCVNKKKQGKPYGEDGDLIQSIDTFKVVVCSLRSKRRLPACEYQGFESSRYIVLGCVDDFPVHLERSFSANMTTVESSSITPIINNQPVYN